MEFLSALQGTLNATLFDIAGTPVTLATIITLTLIILVTLWISKLVQRAISRAFKRRGVELEGTLAATNRLTHYLILIVGLGVALQTVGVNLGALFAAGAVFAVAIGFAMQAVVQNFVSGVILLVERAIKPGDIIELDGRMLRVVEMGIRATIARTLDEEDVIMPNSELVQSRVKNLTLRDPLYRVRVVVGVTYDSDMRQVEQVLRHVTDSFEQREASQEPVVRLSDFGASSVDWEVSIWTRSPWRAQTHRSELRKAIWFAFQEAGIVIAFPQVDVHFDRPVTDALARLHAA